jgi:hypothetical protein
VRSKHHTSCKRAMKKKTTDAETKKRRRDVSSVMTRTLSEPSWPLVVHKGGEENGNCEFARVPNDVLKKIMSFFPRKAWANALLVCKRWASVGGGVFASMMSSKPIVFAMAQGERERVFLFFFCDPHCVCMCIGDDVQLRKWSSHPMLSPNMIDIHMLGVMCRNLRGRETVALGAFIDRCLTNKQEWKQCLSLACDGINPDAMVALERKRVSSEWPVGMEDYLDPVTTLCRKAQQQDVFEALATLLDAMPLEIRNEMLRDIQLCARCCLCNAHR